MMKRGKDEEKSMGPMFPRLNLNDAEKGGPRAPPRNKMALYEQLSIPSQRFKPGMVPTNPNNRNNVVPPASSIQGSSHQGGVFFSVQLSSQAENQSSDSNVPFVQIRQGKKSEEDEFRVPVFMKAIMHEDFSRYFSSNREKLDRTSEAHTQQSTKHLAICGSETRHRPIVLPDLTQEGPGHNYVENAEEFFRNSLETVKVISKSSSRKGADISGRQIDANVLNEAGNSSENKNGRLPNAYHSSPSQQKVQRHPTSRVISDYHSEERRNIDDIVSCEDRTCASLPVENADVGDPTSETSIVDCVSGVVISPDDVVGIIGQKHFWKARRAIANQQRVFGIQVFELHRLIKVQKLMAGSPDLLLESSFLGKPTKTCAKKRLQMEYGDKGSLKTSKSKNESNIPNHKIEGSAENNVGNKSLLSVQNENQLPSSKPVSVNSPTTATSGDHALGPWCFHQQPGHQWLIPVMSPSEGLVYKPYPGPGYMAPFCGGCGPPGPPPVVSNFAPSPYELASSHQIPGTGVPPFVSPAGPHGYFQPYGMPVMNHSGTESTTDHTHRLATAGMPVQPPGSRVNRNTQHHQTCNLPREKDEASGTLPDGRKLHESRDSEVQASTASSPNESGQRTRRGRISGGSNEHPLFLVPAIADVPRIQLQQVDRPAAQVIKVVPHNGLLATESAARIFQSIQQERKQHDS